jgi:type VI secretion system secreted protein VgrG
MSCQSACPNVYTGCICTIKNSAISSQNGDFFVVEARHTINQITEESKVPFTDEGKVPFTEESKVPFYENKLKLIPSSVKFRPNYTHKKNRIYGTQTATVTGASNEEIFCDEKGRIKIKFHWDTISEKDEKSSCWVRVSHSWAGKSFGELIIPRVGMEVVVNFINGDPDQPLVIGCVYNGVNPPPPDYPKNKKTASTFYTHSEKGFNELRFDDAKDKEEIYIHAQKDMNTVVEDSVTETLNEGSKTVTLESKNDKVQHIIIVKKGDYQTTINEGDMSITLDKGNQTVTLKDGDQTIALKKGDVKIDVSGNISIKAKNIDIDADGTFSVNSMKAMSFETKDSASFKTTKDFIVNSTMKITISAKMDINIESKLNLTEKGLNINRDANVGISDKAKATLTIESSAMATIKANAMMDINGGGMLKVAGGMIKLN